MKKLVDICLDYLALSLHGAISQMTRGIATTHKEDLIERLVSHDRLTADYLPHVTYNLFAPTLKRVVFYMCSQITDDILQLLSTSGCQLTEIIINKCNSVTDAGVVFITKDQASLERCTLKSLVNVTQKGLVALHSSKLTKLDISGSSFASNAVKLALKNNPNIRHLSLSYCKKVDETLFPFIAERLAEKLEVLEVVNLTCTTDACLIQLADKCPNLTKLNFYGCNKITNDGLNAINAKCLQLKHLDLSYCSGLLNNSSSAFCLNTLPLTIRELSVCGIMFNDPEQLTAAIVRLTSIRNLSFCGVPALTDEAIEEILSSIGSKLEVLDLNGGLMAPLTDLAVSSIVRHCPVLQNISLSLNRSITGTNLIPLLDDAARASRLTHVHLSLKQLDAEVLCHIPATCVNLEELELSGVQCVTDEFVICVAKQCPRLRFIGLKGCRQITDAGVCALSQCGDLRCVVLSGIHQLTDRSILALANGCPYIDEIYLSGCNLVSRAAIRYLVDSCISRVFWEHKVPNADPQQLVARDLDTGVYVAVPESA